MRIVWTQRLAAGALAPLTGLALGAAGAAAQTPASLLVIRSVDGRANNLQHQTWGQAGVPYKRVAPANYADGKSKQVTPAKPDRYVSNRVFQRRRAEPVLRARPVAVGMAMGPVHRP